MLDFREELSVKEEVEQILRILPFYFRAFSIEELLSKKNIVFIVSGELLYVREYSNNRAEKKSFEKVFMTSEYAQMALTYIEKNLKEKKYEIVKNNLRLYVRRKS